MDVCHILNVTREKQKFAFRHHKSINVCTGDLKFGMWVLTFNFKVYDGLENVDVCPFFTFFPDSHKVG